MCDIIKNNLRDMLCSSFCAVDMTRVVVPYPHYVFLNGTDTSDAKLNADVTIFHNAFSDSKFL